MKKTLIWALALMMALVAVCAPAGLADSQWTPVWENARAGVVQVRAMNESWTYTGGMSEEIAARGSGLYVDEACVVTCAHLVADCDFVQVETADGRVFEAVETLTDATIDLAVLRLGEPIEGLEPLSFDGEAAMCDEMLVIGHATVDEDVFTHTATRGMIAGLNRPGDALGVFTRTVNLIQIDATMYGGFAGAGLFDDQGRVAGMVMLPRLENEKTGGAIFGLGFALPAAQVAAAAADLCEYGVVRRPRMGVEVSEVEGPEEALRNWPPCGLVVVTVEKDGPADRAGVEMYDIITEIDGVRLHNYAELSALLDSHVAGDQIHLTVYRCYDKKGDLIADARYIEMDMTLDMR